MDSIEIFAHQPSSTHKIPLFVMSVSAGLGSAPVDGDIDKEVDLNEFLVEHPASTFFAKVNGDAMKGVGINDGDVLVVDSSVEPVDGKIVIIMVNNELTVKYYRVIDGEVYLQSQNKNFVPIKIDPYMEFTVIGVVTKIIHSL